MQRIIACAIGIGLTATASFAQQGTFNLPVRAHWGKAVLEPGVHKIRTPVPVSRYMFYLSGEEGTQVSTPLTTDRITETNRSYIRVVKVNGEYYVDQFNSGVNGTRFTFATPKATTPTQEAQTLTVGVPAS